MSVPVMCVRPMGMSVIVAHMLVFMNMGLTNGFFMVVDMMIVLVIVRMRMDLVLM